MTGSELKTKLCSTKKFLPRYVYNNIKTIGDSNGELELCDCLLEFLKAYIVIQIKEKDNDSSATFQKWFKNKVKKIAKNQIKDSIRQIKDTKYSFYCEEKKLEFDRKKEFKYIIIFDSNQYDDNYEKFYLTHEGIEMNIFSIRDFEEMLDNIVLPSDIFDFLEFRKNFYTQSKLKDNPLIIDELSTDLAMFGRISSDIQVSDYFIMKKYLMKGLKVEEVYRFNYIVNNISNVLGEKDDNTLELMMSFNRNEAINFINLWDNACENARKEVFVLPNVMHDNENVFLCFSKPINCSIDLFNYNYMSIIDSCFKDFECKRVHLFLFESYSNEQFCISCSIIERNNMENSQIKMNKIVHNKNQSNSQLIDIIDDSITYSVLKKILQSNCTDIYTNNESFIVCYSNYPYPIWVWCKDVANKDDVILISNILKNNYISKGKYNFIMNEELLNKLIDIDNSFKGLNHKMDLLSYKLIEINNITNKCDGFMRKASIEDVDYLAKINKDAHYEMEKFTFSLEECKNKVIELINNDNLYVWCNKDNEIVATINKSIDGNYVKIGLVYTVPKHRRKGYAINIVYSVSKELLKSGLIPILYTDGGYEASNECYKKVGYKQVGKLVNVGNE